MNGGPNAAEGDAGVQTSTNSWRERSAQEQTASKDVSLDQPSTTILIDCKWSCGTDGMHLFSSTNTAIILFFSRLADRVDEISFFVFPFSAPFPV